MRSGQANNSRGEGATGYKSRWSAASSFNATSVATERASSLDFVPVSQGYLWGTKVHAYDGISSVREHDALSRERGDSNGSPHTRRKRLSRGKGEEEASIEPCTPAFYPSLSNSYSEPAPPLRENVKGADEFDRASRVPRRRDAARPLID